MDLSLKGVDNILGKENMKKRHFLILPRYFEKLFPSSIVHNRPFVSKAGRDPGHFF